MIAWTAIASGSTPLLALSHVDIVSLLQVMRQLAASAPPSWLLFQPCEAFLHKPLYPFVGMATAHAHRCGNGGNRHSVNQEQDNPGTASQTSRDGAGPLPRQQGLALGRSQGDFKGSWATTRHTEISQQASYEVSRERCVR